MVDLRTLSELDQEDSIFQSTYEPQMKSLFLEVFE